MELRHTGIGVIGDAPWGTHLCVFYRSRDDLLEIVLPYLEAGLAAGELCLWVPSPPLEVQEAWDVLADAVPALPSYRDTDRIRIIPPSEWQGSLDSWTRWLESALSAGLAGLRVAAAPFPPDTRYAAEMAAALAPQRVLALCTFPEDQCGVGEVAGLLKTHELALVKRDGAWEKVEGYAGVSRNERTEWFRVTLSGIGDGVIATDADGKVTFMNAVAEQLTGWAGTSSRGKPLEEVFHILSEVSGRRIRNPVARVIRSGRIEGPGNHTILVSRDGSRRPVDDSAAPVHDDAGQLIGVVLVFRDTTARRRAEEQLRRSERHFRSLAENVPAVLMRYDADLRVVYLSPSAEEATGIPAARFIGKTNREMGMPAHLCDLWEAAIAEVFRSGRASELEFSFPSPGGERAFLLKLAPELGDGGGVLNVLGISTDVTAQRQVRQLSDALNRINEVLHSSLDPDEVMRRLVSEGASALGCEAAALSVRSGGGWTVRYVHGMPETLVGATMDDDQELHALHALRTGKPVAVADAFSDERFNREHLRRHNIRSVLVVPLIARDQPLGALFLNYHSAPHAFAEAEVHFAEQLAAAASSALENARLYDELKRAEERTVRRNMLLSGIARIFGEALKCQTEEELGRICLSVAEEVTGSAFGFIGEINRETGKLNDIAISDPGWEACRMPAPEGHGRKVPFGFRIHGIYGRVLHDGKGFFTNDPRSHPDSIGTPQGHPPLRCFLGVPLTLAGRTIGIMGLANREGGYGPEDLRAAEALAPAIVQTFLSKRSEAAVLQSAGRLKAALEASGGAIYEHSVPLDESTYHDERWVELLGYDRAELPRYDRITEWLFGQTHPDDRGLVERAYTEFIEGRSPLYHVEFRIRHKAGHWLWVEGHSIATERDSGGRLRRLVGVMTDITERKLADEQLREANLKLVEADRRKNEFLGALSHELRNPLAPIRYSLAIIDHVPPGSEEARRALEVIDRQVSLLSGLVNDLLDLTRITSKRIRIDRRQIDLAEVVERAVEDGRPVFQAADVGLERIPSAGPIPVRADGARLGQVIGNLLSNAAKFSHPGGRTRVFSGVQGDAAVVRVVDDGIGMSPETMSRLFEPFMQADQGLDRGKGGLGLGLALCKMLVELHGGSIEVRSQGLGKGTEVEVRLPLETASAPEQELPFEPPGAPPRRILIIEDIGDAADSLSAVLRREGHEVVVATSGPEGIERARAFRPEVVFCDIGLPGMDGYEVARLFRDDEQLKHALLVALSGYALPDDVRRATESGFDRHLAKPPSLAQIRDILRRQTA
jgi:PAS domain S-box-containing protein